MEIFIPLILSIICLLTWFFINNNDKNKSNRLINKEKNKILNSGFSDENIRIALYGGLNSNHAIITKDNDLFIIKNNGTIEKIKPENIFSIKIVLHVNERNTRRIIAFTSTYDKKVNIQAIDFKIATFDETYLIRYNIGENTPFGLPNENKLDETERFKAVLEKIINESKVY